MDANIATILVALIINVPTLLMLRSNRKKVDSETDLAEASADKASAERRKLEDEITQNVLKRTTEEREKMQAEIDSLRHDFRIVMTFARENWLGSRRLHTQVLELKADPVYVPPEAFPTGPLGKLAT